MTFAVRDGVFAYPGAAVPILSGVDFSVGPERLMAVLGPNGAGKTTLLRTMIGLQRWSGGASYLDGVDLNALGQREIGRRIAYVPQARNASAMAITGLDMVMLGRAPHLGLLAQPGRAEEAMARDMLDEIGAGALAPMPCATMSGGQFQMVLIARALVTEPQVLVLDEPETGLDFHNQLVVLDLLGRLVHERELTVVMNTHYPAHAMKIADQVLLIDADHDVRCGPTEEIMTEQVLGEVFDVDVRITRVEHDGVPLPAVIPVAVRPRRGRGRG